MSTKVYRDTGEQLGFENDADAWVKFTRDGRAVVVDGTNETELDEAAIQHLIAWLSMPAPKATTNGDAR